ncbi:hypothetical protein [Mycobacterium botniense]|nr:hypothetical protein [Mycobacterium botniense]
MGQPTVERTVAARDNSSGDRRFVVSGVVKTDTRPDELDVCAASRWKAA